MNSSEQYSAFDSDNLLKSGTLLEVVLFAKSTTDQDPQVQILLFNNLTCEVFDANLHGSPGDVRKRYTLPASEPAESIDNSSTKKARGRPRLGVIAREITLLPRHWEWLGRQKEGASATIRRLVEEARKAALENPDTSQHKEAVYRFMTVMAGDRPGYEEALRHLYAEDRHKFLESIRQWPVDIVAFISDKAEHAFPCT